MPTLINVLFIEQHNVSTVSRQATLFDLFMFGLYIIRITAEGIEQISVCEGSTGCVMFQQGHLPLTSHPSHDSD